MSKIQYFLYSGYNGRIIRFSSTYYVNLEEYLNYYCQTNINADYFLSKLYQLKEIWNTKEMDDLINREFGGYFDWEILQEIQSEGKWFTFFGFVDIAARVNVETKVVYIENEMDSGSGTTEISFDDLTYILEQFRNYPSGNYDINLLVGKLKVKECEAFIYNLKQCLELRQNIEREFFSERIKPTTLNYDYPYVVIHDRDLIYVHMTEMLNILEQHVYHYKQKKNSNWFRRFFNFTI